MEIVHVVDQSQYELTEIAEKVKNILQDDGLNIEHKSIYLKPSFVFPVPEKMIYTCTNPIFVAGVAAALDQLGARKVIVGEGSTLGPARYNFTALSVYKPFKQAYKLKLIKRETIKFVYHDDTKQIKVNISEPIIKKSFKVPKVLLDADYFFSLPKLKVNIFADVTLSVKNNLGLISMKERLEHHDENLHKEIADLYRVRVPDYIISDAIISGEGQGPMEATPVESNLIIAGRNGLAVDTTCCYLMGIEPDSIEHLKLLHEKGIGPIDIHKINIKGKEILEQRKKNYIMPNSDFEKLAPEIKAFIGEKCCVPGCRGFIRALIDGYGFNLPDGFENLKVNIISGNVEIPEEDLININKKKTIVYGDCAKKYKNYGTFFKGCPPSYLRALVTLRKPMGMITPWWKYISFSKLAWAYLVHGLRKIVPINVKLN